MKRMSTTGTSPGHKCPMCGARLGSDPLLCETCGEDLRRAGVVLSSGVHAFGRPARHLSRRIALFLAALVFVLILAGLTPLAPAVPEVLGGTSRSVRVIVTGSAQRALRWIELVKEHSGR